MTREDLYDWLIAQGCTHEPPQNTLNLTGSFIKFKGKTYGMAYFDMPINNKQVRPTAVKAICEQLYIPIPDIIQQQLSNYS